MKLRAFEVGIVIVVLAASALLVTALFGPTPNTAFANRRPSALVQQPGR